MVYLLVAEVVGGGRRYDTLVTIDPKKRPA